MAYIFIRKEPVARQFLQNLEAAHIFSILFCSSFTVLVPTGKRWLAQRIMRSLFTKATGKVAMELSYKLKHALPIQIPAIVLLGTSPREIKTYGHTETCI